MFGFKDLIFKDLKFNISLKSAFSCEKNQQNYR